MMLLAVFSQFGCEPDAQPCEDFHNPKCVNYIDCSMFPETTAKFKGFQVWLENHGDFSNEYASDTLMYGEMYFQADCSDCDQYKWKLGYERTEHSGRYLDTRFGEDNYPQRFLGQPLPLRLAVHRTVPANGIRCHPNDNGWDTITRQIVIMDGAWDQRPYKGVFEGYMTNDPANVFRIEVDTTMPPPLESNTETYIIKNWNNRDTTLLISTSDIRHYGYRYFAGRGFTTDNSHVDTSSSATFKLFIQSDNSIRIDYLREDGIFVLNGNLRYYQTVCEKPYTFIGRKIQ